MAILRVLLAVLVFFGAAVTQSAPTTHAQQCIPASQSTRELTAPAHELGMWVLGSGTYRVVNVWSNMPDTAIGQEQRKLFLSPNEYVEVLGGGTLFSWPAHCARQAIDGYNQNPLPAVSPGQMANDWLCCGAEVLPLWEAYLAARQATAPPVTVAAPQEPPPPPPPVVVAPQPACPPAQEITIRSPSDVTVRGPTIMHAWWNNERPVWGQQQVKVIVQSGEVVTFVQMLGKVWQYVDNETCRANLEREFQNAPEKPVRTVDDLRREGLVR